MIPLLHEAHRRLKIAWHLDLVADPVTHGWILNLYRAGEEHPQTVTDYFPHEHAPWPELSTDLRRHAADERKHTALYGRAIAELGQPVLSLDAPDVFNHAIRAQTPVGWGIAASDVPEVKRRKLLHFMAHAHHLEARVAQSLGFHAEACARRGRTSALDVVTRVLDDEERHVRYTGDAVAALSRDDTERREVLALHAHAVDRADRAFSSRQVRRFLAAHATHTPRRRRALYRLSALSMEASLG